MRKQRDKLSFASLLLAVLFVVHAILPSPVSAQITDADVDTTIDKMKKWLYSQQKDTGGWPELGGHGGSQKTGTTAIAMMALLSAGETIHDPRIQAGLKYLQDNPSGGTYAVGLRAHVWSKLPPKYDSEMAKEGEWLLRAHRGTLFDYEEYPRNRVDHSVTQYGILGLWEYSKRGGKVDNLFWETAMKHFITVQDGDGGWAYGASGASYGSMTTAGLTVLYIAQMQVRRDLATPDPALEKSIEKGMAWLDKHFDGASNPGKGSWSMYYLYGIERVALAGGVKELNGQDWFETGAKFILSRARGNGSLGSVSDTAFGLGFLARGRVPVWVNKLKVPEQNWNNRPNDVYFWNQFLSEEFERLMNWQVVDVNSKPEDWRNAPVLYLSSNKKIDFTETQIANIKRYIDLGGTFLAVGEQNGGKAFTTGIRLMAQEMYPDLKWQRVKPSDALYSSHHSISKTKMQPINVLSNGARDLVYIVESDWSMAFQRDDPPGKSNSWEISSNFFSLATNRGLLDNRLVKVLEAPSSREAAGEVVIGRAKYEGQWNSEPLVWEALGTHIFNKTGLKVKTQEVDLASLVDFTGGLVHIAGSENETKFTAEELSGIKQYIEGGGTIFIETIGGKTGFASGIEGQIKTLLGSSANEIDPGHPIVTGTGLTDGYTIDKFRYSRYAVSRAQMGSRSKLRAFYVKDGEKDRPAVLLSSEDVSLALLNVRQWGIIGYTNESAKQLMTNLVIATKK